METYALVGHSGTGKSHQAPITARQYGIDYIIDDGLLIKGNLNLAGRSAKRESTRYGAIKRALFNDPEHAEQVKEKIKEIKPEKVLIIGTSRRMTEVIADNLDLPAPSYFYTIEEVSNPEAIKTALTIRAKENRHVIPLPTFAIKKEFPGYIMDPLRSFFSFPTTKPEGVPVERSVVRPVFSTLGSFYIAEHVITDLVDHLVREVPGIYKVMQTDLQNGKTRVVLNIDVAIDISSIRGMRIDALLREVQHNIKEQIEYQTGFYLDEVNVYARKLYVDKDLKKDKEALRQKVSSADNN